MIRSEDVFKSDFKGPIVLHMIDQEGYGDVSLAMKVAKFLMKKYPEAPVYVLGVPSAIQKVHDIEPGLQEQYPKIHMVNTKSELEKVEQLCKSAKLAVETAIFDSSLKSQYYQGNDCPKIFIGEYGLYNQKEYDPPIVCLSGNVGVGENFPGILIEPDLKNFSRLPPEKKLEARAHILSELDPLLKKQVVGEAAQDPSFVRKNGFAFSYYNFPKSYKRAAAVFAASNGLEKHANFFVSASTKNDKDKTVLSMLTEQDFQEKLKGLGYSKLVLFTGDSENPYKEIILDKSNPNAREFRVIQRSRFTHDTTLDLMRLSDVCGVAGDQSLTEAHSLGAVPIPEEWYCQLKIVEQIATTYYNQTVMGSVFNNTWGHETTLDKWVQAGEQLRSNRSNVATVLTKFQEEANLYNALDHRLNLALDKPHQMKISEYNKGFIEALEKHQKDLKKDKAQAFHIATEIARYYAQWQPAEPLTMNKILETMRAYEGKRITHMDKIDFYVIQKKDLELVSSERSGSLIKRFITHKPSHNEQLFTHLRSLHASHFLPVAERSLQAKSNAIKERLSCICHPEQALTEEDLHRAITYLTNLDKKTLAKEIDFSGQHPGKMLNESYNVVEQINLTEQEKPINENKQFTICLETHYASDPPYVITLSKEQVREFSEKQKEYQEGQTFSC
ncbi:hypothetical protein OQJ15_11925 [Fluoribacter dumoffii]|uniref:Uncharacterized protein n=1 Tax=Fluoribacter dumoffii TaxID=463 RepID=A0A377G6R1_9GAMM|nr:hypothetical protein [Fluoribacter dumoffii]KTC92439.1 hypothetical protein Ldum_0245 [Fluoribacter dumoffii NY 23]MCW8387015.1 hypothetical protein [Fluoribacter dumoffii]MCW8497218.1 hypothetical protein [Fluoribacter dumoffii]STO20329.1 Uncharacterised protein [Fluoribacter dumoffii]